MAKTAFLVSMMPTTRVVIDVNDPDNLTDVEMAKLARIAQRRFVEDSDGYLCYENMEVFTDVECPYDPEGDEDEEDD